MEYDEEYTAPAPQPAAAAQGVGPVFEATREFIEEHSRPVIGSIPDPHDDSVKVPVAISRNGVEALPSDLFDGYRSTRRYVDGLATLEDAASFNAHVGRFADGDTAIFLDTSGPRLTAVYGYHGRDKPGAFKHRAVADIPFSDEWKTWLAHNKEAMTTAEFAQFIEENVADLAPLPGEISSELRAYVDVMGGTSAVADVASLVVLSRGLTINENSVAAEAIRTASGEGEIRFETKHETHVGDMKVTVPAMFCIAIPVLQRGDRYLIVAALRYRKTAAGIRFWYDLRATHKVCEDAFDGLVARVKEETGVETVFRGQSEH